MKFYILTLFPEFFTNFLSTSIIGRAVENKKIEVEIINFRDYSTDKHKKVDDVPYGGGAGMLIACQSVFDAVENLRKRTQAPLIYLTPQGETLNQKKVSNLYSESKEYIILCGHYEGVDQRIRDELVDIEISIGDYVLSGGELAATVLIDAISRLEHGVLGQADSLKEESFSPELNFKKEYPQYTRPEDFRGLKVPEVLLSGNHALIQDWQRSNLS